MLSNYTVFSAEYSAFLVCFAGEAFDFYYMTLVSFDARISYEVCSSYLAKKTCLKINIDRLIKKIYLNRLHCLHKISRNLQIQSIRGAVKYLPKKMPYYNKTIMG